MFRSASCFLLLVFASCGGSGLTKVSGKITQKGEPAANVMVIFAPSGTGITGAATTDSDGNYQIGSSVGNGLPPGSYLVKLSSSEVGVAESKPAAETGGRDSPGESGRSRSPSTQSKSKSAIPAKYGTGELFKATVEPQWSHSFDFDIPEK